MNILCNLCRQTIKLERFGARFVSTRKTQLLHDVSQKKLFSKITNPNLLLNKKMSLARLMSTSSGVHGGGMQQSHKTVLLYLSSAAVLACGLSYAAVPLYRLYCQASGYGSAKQEIDFGNKIESMERVEDRIITIRFEAGTSKTLRWKFRPQQKEVKLAPGETSLAFYTAINLTDKPIIGIATYNVIPFDAGQYFNKIQCFCFEEQQLNPGEEVDMPVFFYIDPDFMEDPKMARYDELILSYTFFQSNEDSAPGSVSHNKKAPSIK